MRLATSAGISSLDLEIVRQVRDNSTSNAIESDFHGVRLTKNRNEC